MVEIVEVSFTEIRYYKILPVSYSIFFLLSAILPFLVQASYQLSEHISSKFIELIRLALIPVSTVATTATTVGSTNTSQTYSKKQEKQEKAKSEILLITIFL